MLVFPIADLPGRRAVRQLQPPPADELGDRADRRGRRRAAGRPLVILGDSRWSFAYLVFSILKSINHKQEVFLRSWFLWLVDADPAKLLVHFVINLTGNSLLSTIYVAATYR